jgi:hypothetical protein
VRRHAPNRGFRLVAIGLLGGLLLAGGSHPRGVGAWQATPAAETGAATCNVLPRSIEEILTVMDRVPSQEVAIGPLPEGEPANPATTDAIGATLEEMAACLAAGQMLRFYALHSDEWLRRFAAQVEGLTTLTTSTPPLDDGERAVYLGPWTVQRLPDGRVMAATLLRVGDELRPDPSRTRVLVFAEQGGRWLVDETIARVIVDGCGRPVEVAAVVGPPPELRMVFDVWSAVCKTMD